MGRGGRVPGWSGRPRRRDLAPPGAGGTGTHRRACSRPTVTSVPGSSPPPRPRAGRPVGSRWRPGVCPLGPQGRGACSAQRDPQVAVSPPRGLVGQGCPQGSLVAALGGTEKGWWWERGRPESWRSRLRPVHQVRVHRGRGAQKPDMSAQTRPPALALPWLTAPVTAPPPLHPPPPDPPRLKAVLQTLQGLRLLEAP